LQLIEEGFSFLRPIVNVNNTKGQTPVKEPVPWTGSFKFARMFVSTDIIAAGLRIGLSARLTGNLTPCVLNAQVAGNPTVTGRGKHIGFLKHKLPTTTSH
jgi:hypothetical protein